MLLHFACILSKSRRELIVTEVCVYVNEWGAVSVYLWIMCVYTKNVSSFYKSININKIELNKKQKKNGVTKQST